MSTRDDIADVLMRLSIHNVVNKNHAITIADTFVKTILDEVKDKCELSDFDDRSYYLLCKVIDQMKEE